MQINVVFCFDENLTRQIQATVASLLDAKKDEDVHYEIYCVCTKEAQSIEEPLSSIVGKRDRKSGITVKVVENLYSDAYQVRGISTGTYLRLMLHKILPEIDKILYVDVDVLFRDSLRKLWQTDLQGNVLAAVKGTVNLPDKWEWNSDRPYWGELAAMRGRYINAGVTLLNLEMVRSLNLEQQWSKWARQKLYYQDQDILNLTCQGRIVYLPPKDNLFAYLERKDYDIFIEKGIFTREECEEAFSRPVIIHYAGDKPWKRYDTNLGSLWWDYVNSQPDLQGLFDEKKARKYHGPTLWERGVRKIKKIMSKEKL